MSWKMDHGRARSRRSAVSWIGLTALLAACGGPARVEEETSTAAGSGPVTAMHRDTVDAVALVLDHKRRCLDVAEALTNIASHEYENCRYGNRRCSELREAFELYVNTEGIGAYAAAKRESQIIRKLVDKSRDEASADGLKVVSQMLNTSEELCQPVESATRHSFAFSDERQIEILREQEIRLSALVPLTGSEKRTALEKYSRELEEVAQEALLAVDPIANRAVTAAEYEREKAEHDQWLKEKENREYLQRKMEAERLARTETKRLETQRRLSGDAKTKVAPGIHMAKKDPAPRANTQQYMKRLRENQVHRWHESYIASVQDFKSVLGLYLHPLKEGPPSMSTCNALAMKAGLLLKNEELLSVPEPVVSENLKIAFTHFKAAGKACAERQHQQADAHVKTAIEALGNVAKELQKYGLKV